MAEIVPERGRAGASAIGEKLLSVVRIGFNAVGPCDPKSTIAETAALSFAIA